MQTYDLGHKGRPASITCRLCNMTSYHPEDIKQMYCDHCHLFHDQIGHWLDLAKDDQPAVAEGFQDIVGREVMESLPADSQAGLKKLLQKAKRPTMWERLLDRSV